MRAAALDGIDRLAAAPRRNAALPDTSEEALALAFAERHADGLRYVPAWGRWMHWDGCRWVRDEMLVAFDHARDLCRDVAANCDKAGDARAVASASTVNAVQKLAQADRRLVASVDQWDADPRLLNTPGGLVDLLTGTTRPHDPAAYCSKATAVTPGGDCPTWLRFLNRIMQSDQDMIDYLQRALGYALTGITREHVLWFLYGTGANGKSVLLSTVSGILADYATTASAEVFTAAPFDRHPTELAALAGARLVSASETEEGRQWAESRIKSLTGGDKISARFMRRDLFEFVPVFKLFIAGNHRPQVKNVDEAMRRRIHLVPFAVTIPKEERDPDLTEKLRAEWPGILRWMIEGCIRWQADGLQPPQTVIDATAEYLDAEDAVTLWIEQRCKTGSTFYTPTAQLWADWQDWAKASGEESRSQRWLTEALKSRGFRMRRTMAARGFDGILVKAKDHPNDGHDAS